MSNYPKARTTNLIISELSDELLVYDLKTDKCHCLNKTAYLVWQNCNGKNHLQDIAAKFGENPPKEFSEKLMFLTLAKLEKANLLEGKNEYQKIISKISRREMMQSLALSMTVALPLVASVVAPTSVSAQSCPPAQTCTDLNSVTTCCSNNQMCLGGTCCDAPRACSTLCCAPGLVCIPTTDTCCFALLACGNNCCSSLQHCDTNTLTCVPN